MMSQEYHPLVGILMGSDSDWPKIQKAADALAEFGVAYEVHVMSAHRTPHLVAQYAASASERGLKVIIAAAGGAAHLAGVVAGDVPVACMAVGMGGPRNAGLFAVQILATADASLQAKFSEFKQALAAKLAARDAEFQQRLKA
jgi:5-(carboxyamino)imidazole ribonucleotide mutase